MIDAVEAALWTAARVGEPEPLQLEAKILSANAQHRYNGYTPWCSIEQLYDVLLRRYPSQRTRTVRGLGEGRIRCRSSRRAQSHFVGGDSELRAQLRGRAHVLRLA